MVATFAGGECKWYQSQDSGGTRHQDGAQTLQGGVLDGSHLVFTRFLLLIGKFHNQDTVLCHQTNQHDNTNLAEYIHRNPPEIHEHQCAGNGERHRQHDNQRVLEAFELGGKNQVNQHDGQDEGEHQTGGTLPILFGVSGQCGTEGLVQRLLGNLVHFVQTLSDGLAVCQSRGDGGGNETVVTVQFRRCDAAGKLN